VKQKKSRAAKRRQQSALAEFAAAASRLKIIFAFPPWAYAHGYMLPSLRDSGNAQLQKA
jgi:hypothetical protein